jgi:hypothetical protein
VYNPSDWLQGKKSWMLSENRFALKEWSIAVKYLGEGKQILLLRKGGIREQKKGFAVERSEFFLFPTFLHQAEESLIPAVHQDFRDLLAMQAGNQKIEINCYAVVEEIIRISQLDRLRHLEGKHILNWNCVESRFHYRRPGLHLILLRVYKLPRSHQIIPEKKYEGCVSWVEIEEELSTRGAEMVLPEREFAFRANEVRQLFLGT